MADMAASVLARLKIKPKKAAEAINFACNFFVRKSFRAVWKNQSMQKILY